MIDKDNNFSKIIGHTKIIDKLKSDIKNGNISHAYLFSGPGGVGKFKISRIFANMLQNLNGEKNNIKDTYVIDKLPIEKTEESKNYTNITLQKTRKSDTILIDDIHQIVQFSNQSNLSHFKIIIIKKIERMNKSAFNALLKTLEETPVENTVFILTTNTLPLVPKTIISRCRLVHFPTVPNDEIVQGLENLGYNIENIKKLIKNIPNSPGTIIQLLENPEDLEIYSSIFNNVRKLLNEKQNISERFKYVERIYGSKNEVRTFLDIVCYHLYSKFVSVSQTKEKSKELKDQLSFLQESKNMIRKNVNPRLVLENIMLLV